MTLARIRSLELSAPTAGRRRSTTSTLVIAVAAPSARRLRPRARRRGPAWAAGCMTSLARSARRSAPRLDQAAQVAVGEDAEHAAARVDTAVKPRPLLGHLAQHLGMHACRRRRAARRRRCASGRRRASAACGPGCRPGCERAKSSSRKPRASSSATASASPSAICAVVLAVGARLSGQASWSTALEMHDVGMAAERAVDVAGHRDQGHAEALDRRQRSRRSRRSRRELEIARTTSPARDHAEVAVARFGRVHEERRRAGRGQRRRDLAADVAALAHAHHDDPAAAGEHRADRGDEALALALLQRVERARFDVERRAREAQRTLERRRQVSAGTVIAMSVQ